MNTRKKEILEAVLDTLYSADADRKLTVAAIAERLGIAKSTLYDYFPTKDDMVQAALEMMIEEDTARILALDELASLPFQDAFTGYLRRAIAFAKKNPTVQNMHCGSDFAALPLAAKQSILDKAETAFEKNREALREYLVKGEEEGILGVVDEQRRAMVEATVLGILISHTLPSYPLTVEASIDLLYEDLKTLCQP